MCILNSSLLTATDHNERSITLRLIIATIKIYCKTSSYRLADSNKTSAESPHNVRSHCSCMQRSIADRAAALLHKVKASHVSA